MEVRGTVLPERESPWVARGYVLAACEECAVLMPFGNAAERDEWAHRHADGRGHMVSRFRSRQPGG